MNKIFLYGIANLDGRYEVIAYSYIEQGPVTIGKIKHYAGWLKIKNPSIEHVYAIDGRPGLYHDYKKTKRENTFVSNLTFRDILEREGMLII